MSPLPRTSKPQESQSETGFSRLLRTASAWMTSRREVSEAQPRRYAQVRAEMPVTRDEECLTTHF